jgi:hypothetical protein
MPGILCFVKQLYRYYLAHFPDRGDRGSTFLRPRSAAGGVGWLGRDGRALLVVPPARRAPQRIRSRFGSHRRFNNSSRLRDRDQAAGEIYFGSRACLLPSDTYDKRLSLLHPISLFSVLGFLLSCSFMGR